MPERAEEAAGQELLARTPPRSQDSSASLPPPSLNIPLVLEDMYMRSGISNLDNGHHIPPPPLQVFTFMFRHHFNSAFHRSSFKTSGRAGEDQAYHDFKGRATIFSNAPGEGATGRAWFDYTNGMEMLVEYKPPRYSYLPEEWFWGNPRTWQPVL